MPLPSKPLPPQYVLQEMFLYDPNTGHIFNRTSRTSRRAGDRAEHVVTRGYLQVYVAGALRLAHRVAWAMYYGQEPDGFIDHINCDPADNRIANLRIASHPMNLCNRPAPSHNTSGVKGVHRRRDNGKWRAYISVDGKRIRLGQFDTLDQAASVVRSARSRLHGEFAKG